MVLFYLLGAIVCIAIGVVAFLFYLLNKESAKEGEVKVVPISSPEEIFKPGVSAAEIEYKKKVEELENELTALSEKGLAQAQEAQNLIQKLTKENEMLKGENTKAKDGQAQLAQAQQEVDQIRQDNHLMQTQLESSYEKVEHLQQEAIALRQRLDDETARTNAAIEQLKADRDAVLAKREESVGEINHELEELRVHNEALQQEAADLRLTNQKLKELNNTLMEKSQALQYELTKNRAQVSGLERICENYKLQLEKKV